MAAVRVAMIAAECEPLAKTGGLADVVDALARALPRVNPPVQARQGGPTVEAPVDVFLPYYRGIALPAGRRRAITVRVPDARAGGSAAVRVVPLAADGYRVRLIDYPPAFDRDGIYGHPDDAWRFTILARAALEALRSDAAAGGRPVDVLHLHDWHAAPALLDRDAWLAADPVIGRSAALLTAHNLAYHGWVPRADLGLLGLAPGDGLVAPDATGIDLLWDGIERAELVNTVSPGFAAEALTPGLGFGLDRTLQAKGHRFFGILNGLDTRIWDPATDGEVAARYSLAEPAGKEVCRRDLLTRLGLDATDPGPCWAWSDGSISRRGSTWSWMRLPGSSTAAPGSSSRRAAIRPWRSAFERWQPPVRIRSPSWSDSTGRWPAGSTPAPTPSSCPHASSPAARAR